MMGLSAIRTRVVGLVLLVLVSSFSGHDSFGDRVGPHATVKARYQLPDASIQAAGVLDISQRYELNQDPLSRHGLLAGCVSPAVTVSVVDGVDRSKRQLDGDELARVRRKAFWRKKKNGTEEGGQKKKKKKKKKASPSKTKKKKR